MAVFDVYGPRGAGGEMVVDVQSDLIGLLNTRVVVPLMPPERAPLPARRLNPRFEVAGTSLLFVAQYIAAVPTAELGPRIGSLADERDAIRAALDMLFLGV